MAEEVLWLDVSSQGEVRRVSVVNVAFQAQGKKGGHVESQFDRQTRQRRQNQLLCHQRRSVVQLNLVTLEDKEERWLTEKAQITGLVRQHRAGIPLAA